MICYKNWWKSDLEYNGSKNISVYLDQYIQNDDENEIKILILMEPYEYIKPIYDFTRKNSQLFDLIITYDNYILNSSPNSKKYVFGSSWVERINDINEKKNIISFLVGGKDILPGHLIRHKICDNKKKILHPIHFYNSKNCPYLNASDCKILENSKDEMFKESIFHICIENSIQENYFTEKIIDCFNTFTVPIYWGCPNIGEYFNLKGIIILESDDTDYIIEKINYLNLEEFYTDNFDAIKENYEKCIEYLDYNKQIKDIISDYLKNL